MLVAVTTLRELARRIVSEKEPEVLTDYEVQVGALGTDAADCALFRLLGQSPTRVCGHLGRPSQRLATANDPSC